MTKRERTLAKEGKRLIYTLKQKWGKKAEFYKRLSEVGQVNIETGEVTSTITCHVMKHLIVTSPKVITKFEYDIGFLAANKNFTYGGFYEPGDLIAIVAWSDLPQTDVKMEDYFYIGNKRYNIQRFQIIENGVGWILHLRNVPGDKGYRQHTKYVAHLLRFTETITGEI